MNLQAIPSGSPDRHLSDDELIRLSNGTRPSDLSEHEYLAWLDTVEGHLDQCAECTGRFDLLVGQLGPSTDFRLDDLARETQANEQAPSSDPDDRHNAPNETAQPLTPDSESPRDSSPPGIADVSELAARIADQTIEQERQRKFPKAFRKIRCRSRLVFQKKRIGKGGFCDVLLYRDRVFQRSVAVKVLRHDIPVDLQRLKALRREYRIMAKLGLPGIPEVYTRGWLKDGREFFAMRFIRGKTLSKRIEFFHASKPKLLRSNASFRELLSWMIQICRTVDAAHRKKIIHRDLKPSNVIIAKSLTAFVIDWGLADDLSSAESDSTQQESPSGRIRIGTLEYAAPEQVGGGNGVMDERTDIYLLGGILFRILTNQATHQETIDELCSSSATDANSVSSSIKDALTEVIRSGPLRDPRRRKSGLPAELVSICMKACHPVQASRYTTASDIALDLERWIAGEPVTVHRYSPWSRPARWIKSHPQLVSMIAILLTIVTGLSIAFGNQNARLRIAAYNERERAETAAVNGLEMLGRSVEVASEFHRPDLPDLREIRHQMLDVIEQGLVSQGELSVSPKLRREWTELMVRSSKVHLADESPGAAVSLMQKAVSTFERTMSQQAHDRALYARLLAALAECYIDAGNRKESLPYINRALGLVDSMSIATLAQNDFVELPVSIRFIHAKSIFQEWDSDCIMSYELAAQASELAYTLLELYPDHQKLIKLRIDLLEHMAWCMHKSGRFQDEFMQRMGLENSEWPEFDRRLRGLMREALTLSERLDDANLLRTKARLWHTFGTTESRFGTDASIAAFEQALVLAEQLVEKYPQDHSLKSEYGGALSSLADQYNGLDRQREIKLRNQAEGVFQSLDNGGDVHSKSRAARNLCRLALALYVTGDTETATLNYRKVFEEYDTLSNGSPMSSELFGYAVLSKFWHSQPESLDRSQRLEKLIQLGLTFYRDNVSADELLSEEIVELYATQPVMAEFLQAAELAEVREQFERRLAEK